MHLPDDTKVRLTNQGDTFYSWCTPCQTRTLHVWGYHEGRWTTCTRCHPTVVERFNVVAP